MIFYDPHLPDGVDKSFGVCRVDSLKELMSTSDVISLHCFLDENSKHLINEESLSWVKPSGAYFVNVSRGGLVDEGALIDAIKGMMILGIY